MSHTHLFYLKVSFRPIHALVSLTTDTRKRRNTDNLKVSTAPADPDPEEEKITRTILRRTKDQKEKQKFRTFIFCPNAFAPYRLPENLKSYFPFSTFISSLSQLSFHFQSLGYKYHILLILRKLIGFSSI